MKKVIKKTNSHEPATKADLDRAVTKLATKEELKKAIAKLATKEELNEKISQTESLLKAEIRLTAEETVEKVDEKSRQYRDQILTKFDQFLGEIVTARQERVLVSHRLSNHEERLVELESQTRIPAL